MHGIWGWIFTMPTIGNNWLECELIFFNFINRDVLFYLFFVKTYCYRMLFCLRSLMKNIFSSSSFHFIFFFLPPPPPPSLVLLRKFLCLLGKAHQVHWVVYKGAAISCFYSSNNQILKISAHWATLFFACFRRFCDHI